MSSPDYPTLEYNYGLSSRQQSLNEYAYQNKMDTLFFFQIVLISILILCVFAYGSRIGIFSSALVIYIGVILLVIDVVILAGRMAYTMNLRDGQLWSRRRFAYEAATPAAVPYNQPNVSGNQSRFDLSGIPIGDLNAYCAAHPR